MGRRLSVTPQPAHEAKVTLQRRCGSYCDPAPEPIWSGKPSEELDADLRIIETARSRAAVAGGKLDYSVRFFAARDGPWQAVRQSGALAVMPYDELQTYVVSRNSRVPYAVHACT